MRQAWFRFYEELNDFLPSEKRKTLFSLSFSGNLSVKDAIEALGVPHVEVDMILVNGSPVNFSHRIRNEDRISVYPVFESLDIAAASHLREKPLRETKFILDVHLGKLAKYLRLCGFDSACGTDYKDDQIISISSAELRIILTRDRQLLKNKKVTHGYWIRSRDPEEQLKEVFRRLDLKSTVKYFTRCMECNMLLTEVAKEDIIDRLQPKTRQYFNLFRRCPSCDHIYWEGSHFVKMKSFIQKLENNLE